MKGADIADLGKELAKTVLETLESDAKRQILDDEEHIARVRHVIEGIVACLKRQGVPSKQGDLLQRELKAFIAELFIRRCGAARVADGESNGSEEQAADRDYFEKLYRSRTHA